MKNEQQINLWKYSTILLIALLISINLVFKFERSPRWVNDAPEAKDKEITKEIDSDEQDNALEEKLFSSEAVELPVYWNDLGKRLTNYGVIDEDRFRKIYDQRGGIDSYEEILLSGVSDEKVKLTKENAGFFLNMFWALGLANKNSVLENGPMKDEKYGGAENFASTGGWNIAVGDTMNHYSKYNLIALTDEQQSLMEKVAKKIYRPCCDNSTYFPDCNHGMAMLGFLELMASQGVEEKEMYEAATQLNAYWFPNNYLTIAKYFETQGLGWEEVDKKIVLSDEYSSSSAYRNILAKVEPVQTKSGGGCGI